MKSKFSISPATKIFVIVSTAIALSIIGLEHWLNYQHQTADYTPWKLTSVDSGSSFTVKRDDETRDIVLCGVKASGVEAKNFLRTVIPHSADLSEEKIITTKK